MPNVRLLITVLVLCLAVVGCSSSTPDGHDPAHIYLLRTDPIVLKTPITPPTELFPLGKLDESIGALNRLGGTVVDPAELPTADKTKLQDALTQLFGTPFAPTLGDDPLAAELGLTPDVLARGSRLYKDKCIVCHGMTGDGRGPSGAWRYPHPRDLRDGRFKFVSVPGGSGTATRDDILRLLRVGVLGNAMPSFAMLPPDDLTALTATVIHLSVRGRVERDLLLAVHNGEAEPGEALALGGKLRSQSLQRWKDANGPSLHPAEQASGTAPKEAGDPTYDQRIRRGHVAFQAAGCATCHKNYGREKHYLYDVAGVPVRPSNLTVGEYVGGGEPADLFKRVRCGIAPSGMPGVDVATLPDDAVWDVVSFLRALPVPNHLPKDLRNVIYPEAK